MKNEYLEKIYNRMQGGENFGTASKKLAHAYKKPAYQMFGRICLNNPIHSDKEAAAIVQQLSLAGINEMFITYEYSNQFGHWAAMDAFGLKLRGIEFIDNADYLSEIEVWGSSDLPETIVALRFSFNEDRKG